MKKSALILTILSTLILGACGETTSSRSYIDSSKEPQSSVPSSVVISSSSKTPSTSSTSTSRDVSSSESGKGSSSFSSKSSSSSRSSSSSSSPSSSIISSSSSQKADNIDTFKTITYKMCNSYGGKSLNTSKADTLNVDYKKFVDLDVTTMDKDLAKLGLLLSSELYNFFSLKFENMGFYVSGLLSEKVKLKDVKYILSDRDSYKADANDQNSIQLGHYDFTYKGEDRQVFIILFQGTNYNYEWCSNLDVGAETDKYITKDEPHTEWTHKEVVKGLDVATNRSIKQIDEYLAKYKQPGAEHILFFSGHSRGGGTSALAAKHFTDLKTYKTFCYSFAGQSVTNGKDIDNYPNIFNFVNVNDFIDLLPPSNLQFKRYGKEIKFDISKLATEFKELTNRDYEAPDLSSLAKVFNGLITDRASIYELPETYNDPDAFYEPDMDTENEAKEEIDNMLSELKRNLGFDCGDHIKYETVNDSSTGKWGYKWKYAPALLLDIINSIMDTDKEIDSETTMVKAMNLIPYVPGPVSELFPTFFPYLSDTSKLECIHIPETYVVGLNSLK